MSGVGKKFLVTLQKNTQGLDETGMGPMLNCGLQTTCISSGVTMRKKMILACTALFASSCANSPNSPDDNKYAKYSEGAQIALGLQMVSEEDLTKTSERLAKLRDIRILKNGIEAVTDTMGGAFGLTTKAYGITLYSMMPDAPRPIDHPLFYPTMIQEIPANWATINTPARELSKRYYDVLISYVESKGLKPDYEKRLLSFTEKTFVNDREFAIRLDKDSHKKCDAVEGPCREMTFEGLKGGKLIDGMGKSFAIWGKGASFMFTEPSVVELSQKTEGFLFWVPMPSEGDICQGGYFIKDGKRVYIQEMRNNLGCPTTASS